MNTIHIVMNTENRINIGYQKWKQLWKKHLTFDDDTITDQSYRIIMVTV